MFSRLSRFCTDVFSDLFQLLPTLPKSFSRILFMKSQILFFFLFLFCLNALRANPGDTTLVQAQSDIWLSNFGNYDTSIVFPNGATSYRKILMTFTLGKYQCPGSPQYCGDWDYTVQTFVMTPNGDTLELGRLITPYANAGYPRTPWGWKQRYVFDVTDFYDVLKDNATIRVHYSGYSGGFTANVKFAFIEGIPPRNVMAIERLYRGSFGFGGATPIDDKLPSLNKTAPTSAVSSELKFTVTGHGSDNNGCSEFCSKYYQVILNSNMIAQKNIWRNDCGFNHLYPQSGTWVYDRANWCPGDQVETHSYKLPGVNTGNSYDINVDFEPYTKVGTGNPSYIIESAVFYYGGFNRALDADLTDIISPNNFESHFRQNPLCGKPMVRVKNTGSQTINSVKIQYGVVGDFLPDYVWNGTINSLEEAVIELPEPWSLRIASGDTATKYFTAKILEVNSQADEDSTNNTLTSAFKAAPKWPTTIIVKLTTNLATSGGVSESSWKIVDLGGGIVAQRNNLAASTTYTDTVVLGPSCYKLIVEDQGCDGLYWWANTSAGSGSFQVRGLASAIPFTLPGYFNRDFGCGFTQYFTTNWPTGIPQIYSANAAATIEAIPNPAQKMVTIHLSGVSIESGNIQVLDAMGKLVREEKCFSVDQNINVESLANGVYSVVYSDKNGKLQTRLVIAK